MEEPTPEVDVGTDPGVKIPGDWLTGRWVAVEGRRRRGRRALRRTRSARRSRKVAVDAVRRAGRVPSQADAPDEAVVAGGAVGRAEPSSGARRTRRRGRQDAARAAAHSQLDEPAEDHELVLSVPSGPTGERLPRRPERRRRRRERVSVVGADQGVSSADRAGGIASAEPPAAGLPGSSGPSGPSGPSGRPGGPGRRERRSQAALAKAVALAAADGVPSEERPRAETETLGHYLARVEAPRLRRRSGPGLRWVRLGLAGIVIGGAVVLPWAAPGVPRFLADLVPGGGSVSRVQDPPVAPPASAFTGPVGVDQQAGPYAGVRLLSAGPPREVRVPRLHVDSDVVPISGQSGSLLPPSDPQVLGWWREGQPVGAQYGTAVVTGHTVHTGGGALDQLDKLVVGDTLRVRTDNGWITYAVRQTRIYSTAELARNAEKIFRPGGDGRLVVITCDDWNGSFYESNAVVFASPVLDEPTAAQGAG